MAQAADLIRQSQIVADRIQEMRNQEKSIIEQKLQQKLKSKMSQRN